MTSILLDFSRRPELALYARAVADVEAAAAPLGIAALIAGAFARDLHLWYRHGIEVQRQTEDAHDLNLILQNYLRAGNEQRLWEEFRHWTEEEAFQYELAGARMLGLDVGALLDDSGIDRVAGVLSEQADAANPGVLSGEMNIYEPERAGGLLEAMLSGVLENRHK